MLFNRVLQTKITKYPEQIKYAERLYDNALKNQGNLSVDLQGDIAEEIESLRRKLREYELALKSCSNYCAELASEMENSIKLAEKRVEEGTLSRLDMMTLTAEYQTLGVIRESCKQHQAEIAKLRKALNLAYEQRQLYDLAVAIRELKKIRNG